MGAQNSRIDLQSIFDYMPDLPFYSPIEMKSSAIVDTSSEFWDDATAEWPVPGQSKITAHCVMNKQLEKGAKKAIVSWYNIYLGN